MAENVGHLSEFDAVNSDWSIYKRRLENYFIANDITDVGRKRAILLNLLTEESYKLVYNLCLPDEPEKKSYADLVSLLTEHFKPTGSVFSARYKFYNAKKSSTETAKEWAARLRDLAGSCDFGTSELQLVLRDLFIVSYDRGAVQDRLMEEKKSSTFQDVIEIAAAKSVAHLPQNIAVKIEQEDDLDLHYTNSGYRSRSSGTGTSRAHVRAPPSSATSTTPATSSTHYPPPPPARRRAAGAAAGTASTSSSVEIALPPRCAVCGRRNHSTERCSFRECVCHWCNRKGHLATVCPSKNQNKTKRVLSNVNTNYLECDEHQLFSLDTKISPIVVKVKISELVRYHLPLSTK
ncbi:unnamed protein product [Callosobruchus maculatus]|uniref:CCHC-type domain-containing protein n=1 Tax=Callosobruchus maculatus TaxID=64391 RepID=A0A653CQ83_CALMS|nr:unnamed protein product [Callosobruchus maculatus]